MIRRSPSELYIQYLIVHPQKYSNDQIAETLQFVQLDWLGNYYLDRLRTELPVLPRPFLPNYKAHVPSQRYILKAGLYNLFFPDESTKVAFKILETPRAKEFVDVGLISRVPYQALASFLTESRNFSCQAADVQRYRDYFWNVDLVDRTELKMLLDLRVKRLEEHPDPEIAAQAKVYKYAMQTDAKRNAVDLPYSPLAAVIAQVRMGGMPSQADFAKLVEATRSMALIKAFEAAASGKDRGDHMRFKMYASGVKDLTEVLAEVARPEEDLREQLSAIAMKSDRALLPTLKRLGETNYNSHILEAHGEHIDSDGSQPIDATYEADGHGSDPGG